MDLSAILNEDNASAYQKSISTASDSSHDAATPRTPMEHSPIVACHSQSPEGRRLRHGEDLYRRYSEARGSPDVWKNPHMTSMHQPSSPFAHSDNRPRSRAHGSGGHGEGMTSPTFSHSGQAGWPYTQMSSPGQTGVGRDAPRSPSEQGSRSSDPRDLSRLPSVHDLLMQPEYMTASFSSEALEAAYDTDATISDEERGESGEVSPTASGSSASGPSAAVGLAVQKCAFVADCNLGAPPRRIVSHYFGRNKKETRAIPENVWVFYCRQHYQRAKYRQRTHVYAQTQMRLVRQTVENLERWGGVTDFSVNLRKRAVHQLRKEDEWAAQRRRALAGAGGGPLVPPGGSSSASPDTSRPPGPVCEERWLLPLIGTHKSFQEVYDVIDRVAERSQARQCPAAEFELVPNIKPQYMSGSGSGSGGGSGRRSSRAGHNYATSSGHGHGHGHGKGRGGRALSFEGASGGGGGGFSEDGGDEE